VTRWTAATEGPCPDDEADPGASDPPTADAMRQTATGWPGASRFSDQATKNPFELVDLSIQPIIEFVLLRSPYVLRGAISGSPGAQNKTYSSRLAGIHFVQDRDLRQP